MEGWTSTSEILQLGHPDLRARSPEVTDVLAEEFGTQARRLVSAIEAFRAEHGFGRAIAAPQIGLAARVVAVDLGGGPFLVINPEVTWRSPETFTMWDDCMSFPWILVRLRRHRFVRLSYTDESGRLKEWSDLDQATSELMQHEIDHLDGVLAVDRALDSSALISREMYERFPDRFSSQVDYTIPRSREV